MPLSQFHFVNLYLCCPKISIFKQIRSNNGEYVKCLKKILKIFEFKRSQFRSTKYKNSIL